MTSATSILRELRSSPTHVAAIDLAATVHLTPPALAAEIAALRAARYDIEEHPHFGYRLVSAPDRIIADDLAGMLDGVGLARKIVVFEKTGSTNDVATRMGRDGESEGLIVFAEEQTAGRGRLGRRWESDPRLGLWFSVLLRPAFTHALWTRLTIWAAVAISEAIEKETSCRTAIKWPNDVYIDGKKTVGILIESHFGKSGENFAVLGIGVNVNHETFGPDLADRAASLRMAAGRTFDRQRIATAIITELGGLYPALEHNFAKIVASAEKRNFLKGKQVRLAMGAEIVEGIADRLNADGALVLMGLDGAEAVISSGEVTLSIG